MPINDRYPLEQLLTACRDYPQKKRQRVMFEYTLLAGLYRPDNWERLSAVDTAGNSLPDNAAVIGRFTLK
jgi:adenine C2-methylase RlmN of 23S rRNA A2503 and tRNA A37